MLKLAFQTPPLGFRLPLFGYIVPYANDPGNLTFNIS
jgi:hypothetical protein